MTNDLELKNANLPTVIEHLQSGEALPEGDNELLTRLITEAVEKALDPEIDSSSPSALIRNYLWEHKAEIARGAYKVMLSKDAYDNGFNIGDIEAYIMNDIVFPKISTEILFNGGYEVREFMLQRMGETLEDLHAAFVHDVIATNRYYSATTGYDADRKDFDSPSKGTSKREMFAAFMELGYSGKNLTRQKTLAEELEVVAHLADKQFHTDKEAVTAALKNAGYVLYNELPGERLSEQLKRKVHLRTVEDFKRVIDQMISSLTVENEDPPLPPIYDLDRVNDDMEIHMKRLAIQGEINKVLERCFFAGETPIDSFVFFRNQAIKGESGYFSWLWSSPTIEPNELPDEDSPQIVALYAIADLIHRIHSSGVILSRQGVKEEQKFEGAVRIEFAKLYGREWRAECVEYQAAIPMDSDLIVSIASLNGMQSEEAWRKVIRDAKDKIDANKEVDGV